MDECTEKIMSNKDIYTVFYSDWCGYSKSALELLKKNKLPYKGYKIDKIDGQLDGLLDKLKNTKNLTKFEEFHKTRPVIFYNGEFIGGFQELKQKITSN
jgi:glutaredoxin